jgi:hypothetical protein
MQTQSLSDPQNRILLSALKWPIETMFVGFRPRWNVSASNTNQYRDWHNLSLVSDNKIDTPAMSSGKLTIDDTVAFNAVSSKIKTVGSAQTVERWTYPSYTETISSIQLEAHGIDIFKAFGTAFYRDYTAYTFGGANLDTPVDIGAYVLNFCLFPGTYQPSGHINVSRAREFYISYNSTYISSSTPVDLIVLAKAINFILISDGSAVLRYTT